MKNLMIIFSMVCLIMAGTLVTRAQMADPDDIKFLTLELIMRLIGRDPMRRRIDKAAGSYRVISEQPDRKNLERPF